MTAPHRTRPHTRPRLGRRHRAALALALCLTSLSGCGEDDEAARWEPWALEVEAVVHGLPLACDGLHTDVGASRSAVQVSALRLYVHDVHLIAADGAEVYPTLDVTPQQSPAGVVLLDLSAAACAGEGDGTARARITGLAPRGRYEAVHFEVGLPDRVADASPLEAEAPLGIDGLWDVARADYAFLQLAGATNTGADVRFTLARAGCGLGVAAGALQTRAQAHTLGPSGVPTGGTARCAHPNRAPVTLAGLDRPGARLRFDVGALLSASDLESNAEGTAQGCASAPDDPDCRGPFNGLGLPFGDQLGIPPQRVWSLGEGGR